MNIYGLLSGLKLCVRESGTIKENDTVSNRK